MGSPYSISSVITRKSKKRQGIQEHNEYNFYPLYSTSTIKESYNFDNIKDSIYHWNQYSNSVGNNWSKMMQLYETVDRYGTEDQLDECTNIIYRDIIPYCPTPSMLKKDLLKRINENASDHMKSCINYLIETLNEEIECDRLLNNFNIISKRFDINKLVQSNILFEDAVTDTIYSICSLIDTYDIDYKTKFCIASECTLYSVYNVIGNDPVEEDLFHKKLSTTSLLENVLDYFLINYGRNHVEKFLDEMTETCHKDPFIGDELDSYINHLQRTQAKMYIENVSPDNTFILDDSLYGMSQNMDDIQKIRESAIKTLHEFSIEEITSKAKEAVERIKIAPNQTVGLIKSALSSILVPCRAKDLGKGTHNALSVLFYSLITIGSAVISASAFGLLFGALLSYTLSKHAQKEYLKDAIKEWKLHKYGVERKIKDCTDSEKRRRLDVYLQQVNITLEKLEEKYENERDRTLGELQKEEEKKKADNPEKYRSSSSAEVDPDGIMTPASELYNKDTKTDSNETPKKEDENK